MWIGIVVDVGGVVVYRSALWLMLAVWWYIGRHCGNAADACVCWRSRVTDARTTGDWRAAERD